MPITYEIDAEPGIIFERWSGEILPSDMGEHWVKLSMDTQRSGIYRNLVDVSDATPLFTGAEFWKQVDDNYREKMDQHHRMVAVLVNDEVHEKVARMWVAISAKTVTTRIFYSRDQAMEWLKAGSVRQP